MTRALRLADDERALAGVVGFVLVLALGVSYYAWVVHHDVPRWGVENERGWDDGIAASMAQLARDADNAAGSGATVTGLVPRASAPQGLNVPLLGRTQPVDPDGTLSFAPSGACGGVTLTQRSAARPVRIVEAGGGCLQLDARTTYGLPFGYVHENGALLRVQGADAVVLRGPHLSARPIMDADGDIARLDVRLRLDELRGPAFSASVGGEDAHVALRAEPAPAAPATLAANAERVELVVRTAHVEAWRAWLEERVGAWRLQGPGCPDAGCARVAADPIAGTVTLVLEGASEAAGDDIALSLEQARFLVTTR